MLGNSPFGVVLHSRDPLKIDSVRIKAEPLQDRANSFSRKRLPSAHQGCPSIFIECPFMTGTRDDFTNSVMTFAGAALVHSISWGEVAS